MIVPAPTTMKALQERLADKGVHRYDWFFSTRDLPKEEIEKKVGKP